MEFYSHSKTDAQGATYGSKTMQMHIQGVLNNALASYSNDIHVADNQEQLEEIITAIAKYHDLGKFTSYFQQYLLKKPGVDVTLKQHARIGGITAYNYFKDKNEKLALTSLYVIFRHHTQLCNTTSFTAVFDEHLKRVFYAQAENLLPNMKAIEAILGYNALENYLVYPDEREIRRAFKIWQKRNATIADYFLVNYLFSLLIESDKLDASDTPIYSLQAIDSDYVDRRFGVPSKISLEQEDNPDNNTLRNFCRAEVVSHIGKENILNHKIFTLTAPTGIGKTMTALDFALKLKAKIRVVQNREARIIYALPFINIIEQALKEYSATLPEEVKILGHYQFADIFGEENKESSDSEVNYQQKLMGLDTWQSDVVITSFVQFFETLIGHRNKLLKKFNHFANAIIILDEVQTLRIDQMPLIGASLYYLSEFMNARIVLMTATKPKIFNLAQKEILDKEGAKVKPFELLLSHKKVFSFFTRTKIIPCLAYSFDEEDKAGDFVENIFSQKWSENKSCLIVCNTVNRSIELYQKIREYMEDQGFVNPIEYLSTNIIPAHRFERIQSIKDNLSKGFAPILISTQVVEAGVDLDFDMGFRDLGPIDSIIQVAGRINRNNNPQKQFSPLYIMDFGDARKIYGAITAAQALQALKEKNEIPENEYLELVDSYFDNVSSKNSFARFNKVFESMKLLRYDSENAEEEMPVSKFKIIEESRNTRSVFVEFDVKAQELRGRYWQKITGKISKEEFDKEHKLAFQQHIITIPSYLSEDLEPINEFETNLLCIDNEVINDNYDFKTGFIRQHSDQVRML